MRTLIINSYAGSITIAASQLGLDIIGSYEDEAYGLEIQAENFPQLNYISHQEGWPAQDLSDTIVFAHPPCSAFSVQTPRPAEDRGLNSAAWQCTVNVMTYAMRNKALLLAIESVVPALAGGRQVHDQVAQDHGYQVYRVLQNACSFEVAQFRPRFWIIFVRPGTFHREELLLQLAPSSMTVGQVVGATPTELQFDTERSLDLRQLRQEAQLLDDFGWEMTDSLLHDGEAGLLPAKIVKRFGDLTLKQAVYQHCWPGWISSQLRILDPEKPASVLLGNTWWYVQTDEHQGRLLTIGEYCALMGFPRDYRWGRFQHAWRDYLSRGVCPPVARWLLSQVVQNLERVAVLPQLGSAGKIETRVIRPGEVANFNPQGKTI